MLPGEGSPREVLAFVGRNKGAKQEDWAVQVVNVNNRPHSRLQIPRNDCLVMQQSPLMVQLSAWN